MITKHDFVRLNLSWFQCRGCGSLLQSRWPGRDLPQGAEKYAGMGSVCDTNLLNVEVATPRLSGESRLRESEESWRSRLKPLCSTLLDAFLKDGFDLSD